MAHCLEQKTKHCTRNTRGSAQNKRNLKMLTCEEEIEDLINALQGMYMREKF